MLVRSAGWRKPCVCVGLFWALLIFSPAGAARNAFAAEEQQSPVVQLGGQQAAQCSGAPIYRRFTWLTIDLEGVALRELDGVSVALEPLWQQPNAPPPEILWSRFHPTGIESARAVLQLESGDGPLAVGPYRAAVYRRQDEGFERIAEQTLYVIFNAFDQADRDSHHWRASDYLSNQMHIAQKSEDGEVRLYDWQLDVDRERVFRLAVEAVAGSRHPANAVEQVARVTASRIEGYWPNLGVVGGRASDKVREDDSWKPAAIRSISQRLRYGARRGQCFDYAAFSVALLRSVGLVATAASVVEPAQIEHPRTPNRRVSWSFHVWTEVFVDGHWRALDVAYLDALLHQSVRWPVYPGLQPADGPWFARMVTDRSRVYRQRGRRVVDITGRYSER
ncbi:MAG: transglutaminase domain-containing protein [Thermoguttaceae bacterium]